MLVQRDSRWRNNEKYRYRKKLWKLFLKIAVWGEGAIACLFFGLPIGNILRLRQYHTGLKNKISVVSAKTQALFFLFTSFCVVWHNLPPPPKKKIRIGLRDCTLDKYTDLAEQLSNLFGWRLNSNKTGDSGRLNSFSSVPQAGVHF